MEKILNIREYLKVEEQKEFLEKLNHGIAIAKVDIDGIDVKRGDEGMLTAYLPDMQKFAVMFSNMKWITFDMTEEEFKERFEIIKEN